MSFDYIYPLRLPWIHIHKLHVLSNLISLICAAHVLMGGGVCS